MLSALHIENIAIIDRLDVEFGHGFIVLTGETGAGKSIIIDSIQLLLGNKASKDLVRTGADAGVVSACFCALSDEAIEVLRANGLAPDEDGNVTIYRKIGSDGRNNTRINGINVTVSILRQVGEHLVNIHGQHDGVLLLDHRRHLGYLDAFGEIDTKAYESAYEKVKKLRTQLTEHQIAEANKEQRIQQISEQLARLDACNLQLGEYADLMNKRKNHMMNTEIIEALHIAVEAIYDGEVPASQLAKTAHDQILSIEKNIENGEELARRINQISVELDDLGAELGKMFHDYADNHMDPNELETRLDALEAIQKEFGPNDEDVLKVQAALRQELQDLEHSESSLKELEAQYTTARSDLDQCADQLTALRKRAAEKMEHCLQNELVYLDMPKARFSVRVCDRLNDRGGLRYRKDGKDDVEFFLSANVGEELRPLSRIASGGELSRIMLSIKGVLNQDVDTVVYDEVDTGVSGATAEKIGKKLHASAVGRQVFCITHLAQIAACADHHYKVVKSLCDNRVCSQIVLLNHEDRIQEVARIMGGEELSETLLSSAKEIIENSKNND